MFRRVLRLPGRSFLLFGPRGTGKTTWLRQELPDALWFNLLLDREVFRLMRDPGAFRQEVESRPAGSWIVVDEIQKHPDLLNDVHDLLSAQPKRWRFALTGSSARKLRRGHANLLAGRVINRRFFPLTSRELNEPFDLDDLLRHGMLPLVRAADSPRDRVDLLEAYVETYLAQEIRAEALVRNLASFTRFLEVAALMNGQIANLAGLARDAAVARPTVQGFFDILEDTLVLTRLPAWRPRAKVKEVDHPKLYFFDAGVIRALTRRAREPLEAEERGRLLETYLLHELRAHAAFADLGGEFSYWRTPSGSEVDFVWSRGRSAVGIEVKASARWPSGSGNALNDLLAAKVLQRGVGVYLGERRLKDRAVEILPLPAFLAALERGEIIR